MSSVRTGVEKAQRAREVSEMVTAKVALENLHRHTPCFLLVRSRSKLAIWPIEWSALAAACLIFSVGPKSGGKRYAILGSCLSRGSNRRWRSWICWYRRNRDRYGENPLCGFLDSLYREFGYAKARLTNLKMLTQQHVIAAQGLARSPSASVVSKQKAGEIVAELLISPSCKLRRISENGQKQSN